MGVFAYRSLLQLICKQFDYITVYCATKYFVEGLAVGLRREVKGYNIRVTNIQPGVDEGVWDEE